jgi:hypothetical protein
MMAGLGNSSTMFQTSTDESDMGKDLNFNVVYNFLSGNKNSLIIDYAKALCFLLCPSTNPATQLYNLRK